MKIMHPSILRKKKRFNPHRAWMVLCVSFVVMLIVMLGYFSWYFMQTAQSLDAPVAATFETNAAKIQSMQKTLDEVEGAIELRIGRN